MDFTKQMKFAAECETFSAATLHNLLRFQDLLFPEAMAIIETELQTRDRRDTSYKFDTVSVRMRRSM